MIDWCNWSKQIPGCQGVQYLLTEYMLRCHGCTCYMHVRGHDLNPRLATRYKQSANLHDNLTISECIRFATCLKRIPEPLGTVQQPFFFRVSLNLNWFLGLYTSSHSNGVGQFVWWKALPFPVTQDGPLNQRKTSCVKSRPTPAFHSVKSQGIHLWVLGLTISRLQLRALDLSIHFYTNFVWFFSLFFQYRKIIFQMFPDAVHVIISTHLQHSACGWRWDVSSTRLPRRSASRWSLRCALRHLKREKRPINGAHLGARKTARDSKLTIQDPSLFQEDVFVTKKSPFLKVLDSLWYVKSTVDPRPSQLGFWKLRATVRQRLSNEFSELFLRKSCFLEMHIASDKHEAFAAVFFFVDFCSHGWILGHL